VGDDAPAVDLLGVIASPMAYALRPYVIAQKTPLVVMNAGADGLTQRQRSAYVFRTSFSNSDSSHPLGEWAYKQGYRKMVLMGADFVAAYEHMGGIARTFTEAGGQVIQEVYPPLGSVDFAPFLAQIRRDADVVATFFAGADAIRFVKQYEEYGLKGKIPIIGKGLTQGDVLPKMGESAVGIVSAIHWVPAVDTPENRRFMEAYAAKYKRPAVDMAEQGYVGAQAIARALEGREGKRGRSGGVPRRAEGRRVQRPTRQGALRCLPERRPHGSHLEGGAARPRHRESAHRLVSEHHAILEMESRGLHGPDSLCRAAGKVGEVRGLILSVGFYRGVSSMTE